MSDALSALASSLIREGGRAVLGAAVPVSGIAANAEKSRRVAKTVHDARDAPKRRPHEFGPFHREKDLTQQTRWPRLAPVSSTKCKAASTAAGTDPR